ncbi:hypothetical protein [Mesorhizobium sp.]|uniref:hypothetical protein n=1 Tax=Mesorhizobium sp. TaxID=1871066 RepID=UPI00121F9B73|nr:hypothetical protein [Mesorhizobium sp.]TIN82223.1 MAG: hypothetical protein E5X97_31210 [Mesorhizobium sp.]
MWQQINTLFRRNNLPPPHTSLRDELVTILAWARYGQELDAAIEAARPITAKLECRCTEGCGKCDTRAETIAGAILAERDRCLKIADAMPGWMQPRDVAARIRKGGE